MWNRSSAMTSQALGQWWGRVWLYSIYIVLRRYISATLQNKGALYCKVESQNKKGPAGWSVLLPGGWMKSWYQTWLRTLGTVLCPYWCRTKPCLTWPEWAWRRHRCHWLGSYALVHPNPPKTVQELTDVLIQVIRTSVSSLGADRCHWECIQGHEDNTHHLTTLGHNLDPPAISKFNSDFWWDFESIVH